MLSPATMAVAMAMAMDVLMAAMADMADPMEAMVVMDMARGRLRPPLMLSPAMDMADLMDTALMAVPMVDMVDMADLMEAMEVTDMARGRLRPPLLLSPAMAMDLMADLMEAMVDTDTADLMVDMVDTEATAMESKHHLKEPSNQLSCCN